MTTAVKERPILFSRPMSLGSEPLRLVRLLPSLEAK